MTAVEPEEFEDDTPTPPEGFVLPDQPVMPNITRKDIYRKLAPNAETWEQVSAWMKRRARHALKSSPYWFAWLLVHLPIWLVRHGVLPVKLGLSVMIAGWWVWVTCNDYMAPLLQQNMDKGRAVSAEEIEEGRKPTQTPTQRASELYRHRRNRWLLTLSGLLVVLNLPWILDLLVWTYWIPEFYLGWAGVTGWSPLLYQLTGVGLLLTAEELGRRYVPAVEDEEDLPRTVLSPNIPIGQLKRGIEAYFEAWGLYLRITGTDVHTHGFRFVYYCQTAITENILRQLEIALSAAPFSIRRIQDPEDASAGILSLMTSDPLEGFVPSPKTTPSGMRTILEPLDLGPCEDGTTTGVTFAHCPCCLVIGQTGGGKSGITNNVVERLTDTRDGYRVFCVDPTDGPDSNVLAGFYTEFDGRKVQTEEREAEALIDFALADCKARNRAVSAKIAAVRPDPVTGKVPRGVPRNHHPTEEEPQTWVVVEEYPQTKEWKGFREKVEKLVRIGRKGAWGVIIVSQSATKTNGLGSVVLQAQATIRLIASIKNGELPYAIGQGAAEAGYTPEKLVPATKVKVNDAGKFYSLSSDRSEPVLTRAYGLEFEDIIERVFERTGNWDEAVLTMVEKDYADDRDGDGIPDEYDADPDDAENTELAEWVTETATPGTGSPGPSTSSSSTGGAPNSPTTPPLLTLLLKVAESSGYTRIPTKWILTELQSTPGPWKDWDANQLGQALRQIGMPTSTRLGKGPWGNNAKGYRKADVEAVIGGARFDDA